MKAVNLYLLTRNGGCDEMSMLFHALSARPYYKAISPHEAASLKALADDLASCFTGRGLPDEEWLSAMDGFYFSYTIEHIGKEFDLLKLSEDTGCVLNIELKSEQVSEEKIRRQLSQNRYYLAHISRTIYSCTYVLETGCCYFMNDRGHLRTGSVEELADYMLRDAFSRFVPENISRCFRASDYLISPVAAPEKFLQGQYFLTNQQFDFRRQILEALEVSGTEGGPCRQVISIEGIAGTGKTLLLFDLALQLSRKNKVLLIHSGRLREGHRVIDRQLKRVDIVSGNELTETVDLSPYAALLIDEADRLAPVLLSLLLENASGMIPVILTYDPRVILGTHPDYRGSDGLNMESDQERFIKEVSTLHLAFSGNIRINRPVYSFLRALIHPKEPSGYADYSCIDVLCASDSHEEKLLAKHYTGRGYHLLRLPRGRRPDMKQDPELTAVEFDKVLLILDDSFCYDQDLTLTTRSGDSLPLEMIYEGLSRTRENLCIIISGNGELYSQVLSIRAGRSRESSRR